MYISFLNSFSLQYQTKVYHSVRHYIREMQYKKLNHFCRNHSRGHHCTSTQSELNVGSQKLFPIPFFNHQPNESLRLWKKRELKKNGSCFPREEICVTFVIVATDAAIRFTEHALLTKQGGKCRSRMKPPVGLYLRVN